VAARAGVHVTTVSLALRDSAKLPAATKDRIRALAAEMGYQPDAALNALNAYRSVVRAPAYQATVAWINNYPQRGAFLAVPTFPDYLEGACRRGEELGYRLEEAWIHEPGVSGAALRRRLLARGIRGMLIMPRHEPGPMPEFDWSEFSAVAIGYSIRSPQFHRVTNHQFRSMLTALRELCLLGYRRIGLVTQLELDRRVNLSISSSFLAFSRSLPEEDRVPLFEQRYLADQARFLRGVREHRPQVILSQNFHLWDWLMSAGISVPDEVGLAYFSISHQERVLSGVNQNNHEIGRAAFDLLVSMLHRNERGVPPTPHHVLVDGTWVAGRTTRRVGPPVPWFLDEPVPPMGFEPPAPARPARARRRR
jgi:LacI family transcriptional regulator